MTKKKAKDQAVTIGVRLSPELVAIVDRYVARMSEKIGKANRSDVIRAFIIAGTKEEEGHESNG